LIYDALACDSDARELFFLSYWLLIAIDSITFLGFSIETAVELILTRARALEKHVYEKNLPPEGTPNYRNKMRSFYLNLKAAGNPALREDVVSGEVSVKELYDMDPKVSSCPFSLVSDLILGNSACSTRCRSLLS